MRQANKQQPDEPAQIPTCSWCRHWERRESGHYGHCRLAWWPARWLGLDVTDAHDGCAKHQELRR